MILHCLSKTACLPGLAIALLAGFAPFCSVAGQAASAFEVTVSLVASQSPPGVVCSSNALPNALVCMKQSTVAGQAGTGEPVVMLYGKGLLYEEGRMWGAVAVSRRVYWGGRDYLEMTLTW